jgi:hypothetical protein
MVFQKGHAAWREKWFDGKVIFDTSREKYKCISGFITWDIYISGMYYIVIPSGELPRHRNNQASYCGSPAQLPYVLDFTLCHGRKYKIVYFSPRGKRKGFLYPVGKAFLGLNSRRSADKI